MQEDLNLFLRKGTTLHGWAGRGLAALMLAVTLGSFWITGLAGPGRLVSQILGYG